MKIKIILALSVLLFTTCKTESKEDNTTTESNPISIAIEEHGTAFLEDPQFSSVSIGVYKDGEEYTGHYGELDKGKGNKPSDHTLYEIASVSKTFAGTLAAKAVLDGKLSLDDDIRKYLEKDYPNLADEGAPIRIKHLLSHTSRLPKFLPVEINPLFDNIDETLPFKIYEIEKNYSKEQFLEDIGKLELDMAPGIEYAYSNADTELLAHILENVYQKPYEQVLIDNILSELGMSDTKIHLSEEEKVMLANGYGETSKPVPHMANTLWGAGGGMVSSTSDLLKYMKFQLAEDNPLVQESHRVIFETEEDRIAYYWPIDEDEEDGLYYGHHGGAFGTQNWFFVMPKHNMGISVITNQSGMDTAGELIELVNAVLDDIR